MLVKVAPMGEQVVEVNVAVNSSVSAILEIADIDDNGRSISVNNVPSNLDTLVDQDNSVISLANKMKGGR